MMRIIKIVLVPVLLLCAGGLAAAQPFTALWIFGDSTVDTGWYINRKSDEPNYDHYMYKTTLGVGRPTTSPGLVSVEVLAAALGVMATPADQTKGTNYATGGARNVGKNTMPGDGFPGAVPTVTQMKRYLAHHTANSTALYVISSGDNDVAFALKHPGNKRYLQKVAYALAIEIYALTQNGNHAKYIIVVGLPQSYGSTQQKKTFRATYNTKLQNKLKALHVSYLWGMLTASAT